MALVKLNPTKCTKCGRMNSSRTKVLTKRTRRFRITCGSCGHTYAVDLSERNKSQTKYLDGSVS